MVYHLWKWFLLQIFVVSYTWGNHGNIIIAYYGKIEDKCNFDILSIVWMITHAYITTLIGIKIIAH